MAEENAIHDGGSKIDIGAVVHSSAGIIALVLGGLMYVYAWATPLFSGLMILSAISAVWISAMHNSWVLGHWLAMLPVIGIVIGYMGATWGFTLAYVCLWIAFGHFIERGVKQMREARAVAISPKSDVQSP